MILVIFGVGISYPDMHMPDQVLHPSDTSVGGTMNCFFYHVSTQLLRENEFFICHVHSFIESLG